MTKTTSMNKVLIALDYDPSAQKVAETGYSLGKSMQAEITLMHVISEPVYYASREYSPVMGFTGYMEMGPMQLVDVDRLKEASENYLERTKSHLADTSIRTLVKEGDFAQAILEGAKEMHADVVVMGSHSRKWLENIIMGSVTEEVLRHISVPLFIVPTRKEQ